MPFGADGAGSIPSHGFCSTLYRVLHLQVALISSFPQSSTRLCVPLKSTHPYRGFFVFPSFLLARPPLRTRSHDVAPPRMHLPHRRARLQSSSIRRMPPSHVPSTFTASSPDDSSVPGAVWQLFPYDGRTSSTTRRARSTTQRVPLTPLADASRKVPRRTGERDVPRGARLSLSLSCPLSLYVCGGYSQCFFGVFESTNHEMRRVLQSFAY